MTKKERMLAAIRREPQDRIPTQIDFSPKMLDLVSRHYGVPNRGEEELLGVMDNHLVYGFLNDPFGKQRHREISGNPVKFDHWGIGYDVTQEGTFEAVHPLEDADNLTGYTFPDPNAPGLLDWAEAAIRKYGDDYVVASYQVLCLIERASALRGFENFLCDLYDEEDFMFELLDGITDYQCRLAKRYIRAGVSAGRVGDDYGTQNGMLIDPDQWRKILKPRLAKITGTYKNEGIPVIMHSCGDIRPIIPDLIEIGVDVLNNVQPEAMPREDLVQYRGQITFYGGISTQRVLVSGTEEEIYNEVKTCCDMYGPGNGLLLSTGISVMSDVPLKNLNALMTAFNELTGSRYQIIP
ncbi:MAG: hypothetical protein IJ121_11715 [Eubacterium sp.]|nr:hypothetical protein [Eubacterium sp.]